VAARRPPSYGWSTSFRAWSVRLVMHMAEGVVAGMVRHTYTRTLTAERESAAAAKDTVSSVAVDSIVT